jgi:hypothetical protein
MDRQAQENSTQQESGVPKEKWTDILRSLDSRTKVLGLIILVVEALFVAAIFVMPKEQIVYAIIICAVVLVVGILGIVRIESYDGKAKGGPEIVVPDPKTPHVDVLAGIDLDDIVNGFIQAICGAFSLPYGPEKMRFRIFIFQKKGAELVCTHHWAPNPVSEKVNKLRFQINWELAKKVAVVRAFMDEEVCKTKIEPLPSDTVGVSGDPEPSLKYVLAAPINKQGEVWGTVDIDTADEAGIKILESLQTESALFRFAKHLGFLLHLSELNRE